jgi:hypothetical protein
MAVSAIHPAGLQPAASPEAKSHRSSIPLRLDFAAMLAAFDGPDASDGVLPPSTIGTAPEQPALGAEAFRSSTFAGHMRLTTIVFSDGTSETRLDEMGADSISAPPPRLIPNVATPRFAIGAFSEPERDLGGRVRPATARRKIIGGRGRGTDWNMSDGDGAATPPRRLARITSDTPGRVIDIFA